jgi:hypothetical protein
MRDRGSIMEEMLFLQKEKVMRVRILEKVPDLNHERLKLEVLKNLAGPLPAGSIFEVKRIRGDANNLFGDTGYERFVLI